MPGTLDYNLVEKHIDLGIFDGKYSNDETGRLAYDPKVLLKVVLLGYSRGLMTTRKIEQACKDNIVLMALSCSQHPVHSTIASFVSSIGNEILPLFRNILMCARNWVFQQAQRRCKQILNRYLYGLIPVD
jgi:transposase